MATSGSTSVTVTSWDTLKFSWWENSQSISANTTTIGWKLELIAGSSGRISSTASKTWKVTVDGKEYSGTNTIGISNNATKTLASGTTVIYHNADGTKTFSYSFSQYFGITFSGSGIVTKSGSGTGTLDTIPRATTPTLSASSVYMGSNVTINTPRASSSFTHDLDYSFNGASYVSIATGVSTSYNWTVPDKASSIPSATSGTMTVRCITKNGSTTIGTKYVTLTARVPASVVPTISALTVSEATSGLAAQFGAFIQGKSSLSIKVTAAGAKGSTIKSYKTTLSTGESSTSAAFTSAVLAQAGTVKITATVTDSRGRTATRTVNVTVLAYTKPAIQALSAYRCDASGAAVDDGEYIAVRYQYSVPELNGGNTAEMSLEYKQSREADTEYTMLLAGTEIGANKTEKPTGVTFSQDYSYSLRLTVIDYFGAETVMVTQLPSAEVILDIAADGKGLSIGGTAEQPGFTVKWLMQLAGRKDPVLPDGTDLDDVTVPNSYAGNAATTAGYLNCPVTTGTSFTLEVFSAGSNGQLFQRLTTCSKTGPAVYVRFYYSDSWGDWLQQ